MLGKGLAGGTATLKRDNGCLGGHRFGSGPVVTEIGLEVLKLHLQLFDQPSVAFGAMAILLAPELGDLEPQVPDHVRRGRNNSAGLRQFFFLSRRAGFRRSKGSAQNSDLWGGLRHAG